MRCLLVQVCGRVKAVGQDRGRISGGDRRDGQAWESAERLKEAQVELWGVGPVRAPAENDQIRDEEGGEGTGEF